MKYTSLRSLALTALFFAISSFASAENITLGMADGQSHVGYIYKVIIEEVSVKTESGERLKLPYGDFDAATQKVIDAWKAANPLKVDVYSKFDAQPVIKSSSMPQIPEQFLATEFRGMVSVDLVLDETGRVVDARIKKSTHSELEMPSIAAAKTWLFVPAQVGGKPVKAKLRVPFKFTYVPPPPEEVIEEVAGFKL